MKMIKKMNGFLYVIWIIMLFFIVSCKGNATKNKVDVRNLSASEILGNKEYLAISYGGYRQNSRDIQPTIKELKDDLKILSAMKIKVLRTYNVHLKQAANLLEAINQLKQEESGFEMYVMLGAWIDCKNAFNNKGKEPNHLEESERNAIEIETAVTLAKKYPEIVKIISVGNEAMVKWATSYYVQPKVILKWVNYLQKFKKEGELPSDLWVTSSDNFASWGGGDKSYHTEDLTRLIKAVDFISMHTYPMHDTHYNPVFWKVNNVKDADVSKEVRIDSLMKNATKYAVNQYKNVKKYVQGLGVQKPIHIGETGWATKSNGFYGSKGSKATDEYKQAFYYKAMRDWSNSNGITCFYFEAFDEQWKDAKNPEGSENHFGLLNNKSEAKFALWHLVDKNVFKSLTRNNLPIVKSYNGNKQKLMEEVLLLE